MPVLLGRSSSSSSSSGSFGGTGGGASESALLTGRRAVETLEAVDLMEAFEGRGFTVDLAGDAVEILEPEGVRLTPLGRSTLGSGGRCEGGVGSFLEGAFVPVFDGVRLDTVDVAEAVEPRLARRGCGELGADFSPDAFRFLPAVVLLLAETAELLDAVESVRCLGGRSG